MTTPDSRAGIAEETVVAALASAPGITVLPMILPGEAMEIRRPRIYLSGPMTGLPECNHPAFDAAAARWDAQGWVVLNPADACDRAPGLPRRQYMRWDLGHLLAADAIALLDGWRGSIGARLEVRIAVEVGLLVLEDGTERDHRVWSMPLSRRPFPASR